MNNAGHIPPAPHFEAESWQTDQGTWIVRCACDHESERPTVHQARALHDAHLHLVELRKTITKEGPPADVAEDR